MSGITEKLQLLHSLTENEFRKDVIIPILKNMGFIKVRERHGPKEYGKDVTFIQSSPLGEMHYAVVAKVGNISGAASGKQTLHTVTNQIDQAFSIPYEDVEDKKTYPIDRVIVWTTGTISNNAQDQIIKSVSNQYKYVDFKDGGATIELLDQYFPSFFTIRDPVISEYFDAIKKECSRLEELRALGMIVQILFCKIEEVYPQKI